MVWGEGGTHPPTTKVSSCTPHSPVLVLFWLLLLLARVRGKAVLVTGRGSHSPPSTLTCSPPSPHSSV